MSIIDVFSQIFIFGRVLWINSKTKLLRNYIMFFPFDPNVYFITYASEIKLSTQVSLGVRFYFRSAENSC